MWKRIQNLAVFLEVMTVLSFSCLTGLIVAQTRVLNDNEAIDSERMRVLQHANPLAGLSLEDVQTLRRRNSIKGSFVSTQTEQQVWMLRTKVLSRTHRKEQTPSF